MSSVSMDHLSMYLYIVRKFAGQASLVYKVDVKDGKETMVRAGNFSPINLPKLKRLLGGFKL